MKKKLLFQLLSYLLLSCLVNLDLSAQETKPNWEIFYGDSLIIKSHVEVRNMEKPTVNIHLSDAKDLKININTFEINSHKLDCDLKIIVDSTVVIKHWGFGYQFIVKHEELAKLEKYKGRKAMLIYYEANYQKAPTLLGNLLIK